MFKDNLLFNIIISRVNNTRLFPVLNICNFASIIFNLAYTYEMRLAIFLTKNCEINRGTVGEILKWD